MKSIFLILSVGLFWIHPAALSAHPMVQNGLEVVVEPGRIVVTARIAAEQITLVDGGTGSEERSAAAIRKHAVYVRDHLHVRIDDSASETVSACVVEPSTPQAQDSLIAYRLEYPTPRPARTVRLEHDFLQEKQNWTATCVLRIRQSTQAQFDVGLLPAGRVAVFDCQWPAAAPQGSAAAAPVPEDRVSSNVHLWPTFREYVTDGITHILTGYDHLLFITALVLAVDGLWALVKVVTAFTLAHTLTLALSVFNVVSLGERVVEPVIAASIVFVAIQNVWSPRSSRGWMRLGVAFLFGLFHGLGFAGGLKEAMVAIPAVALWIALIGFSLGVELGHQIVVIPVYTVLRSLKGRQSVLPAAVLPALGVRQACSLIIGIAGVWFLAHAVHLIS